MITYKFSNLVKLNINRKEGFSLIELILYMGILSILIVALFQLLNAVFDVQLESQSTSSVSSDAGYLLSRLEYDIGRADTVILPTVGNQGESLEFRIGIDTYTYSLQDNKLILNVSPTLSQDQLNSFNTRVTALNFQRLSDNAGELDSIIVTFTLESMTQRSGGPEIESFRTTLGTR